MISPEKQEELRKLLEEKLSMDNLKKLIKEHSLDPRTDKYDQFMINYMIKLTLSILNDENPDFITNCNEYFEDIFGVKPRDGLSAELIIWCMVKELYPVLADSTKHDVRVYGDKPEEGYDQLDVVIQDDDKIDKLYTVKDTDIHKKEVRELQALVGQLEYDDKLTDDFLAHMIGTKDIVSTAVPLAKKSFTPFPINIDTLKIEPYKLEFTINYQASKPYYDIKVEMTEEEQKHLQEIALSTGSKKGDTITLDTSLILEPNENIIKLLDECGAMEQIEKIAEISQTIKQQCIEKRIADYITLPMYLEQFIVPDIEQKEGTYEVCIPMYRIYNEHKIPTSKVILEFYPNDIHLEHTMIIDTEARQAMWKDKDGNIIQHLNKELFLKYKDEIEKKIKKS